MRRVLFVIVGVAVLLLGGGGSALARPAAAGAAAVFAEANERFAEATALRATDEAAAQEKYFQAIGLYRRLIDEFGVHSGGVYYNLGNAYALAGDVGRAIANYRRAARLTPGNADLLANLSVTRSKVATRVEPAGGGRLVRTLLAPHYDIPARVRMWVMCGALGLGWMGLALRVDARRRGVVPLGVVAGLFVVGVLGAVSLVAEDRGGRSDREAVVVAESVMGRKGPDERGYEPSFVRALTAGVEVRVVEERSGWVLIRLGDGRETWVPRASIEVI